MDGVLCDFVGGVRKVFNMPTSWSPKNYDLYKEVGVSSFQFWSALCELGADFWVNLEPIKNGIDLFLNLSEVMGKVFILTSPPLDTRVASWKLEWVRRYIATYSRKTLVVPAEYKYLLSGQGRVLIDDSYKNCINWDGESYLLKTSYTPKGVKGYTFEEIKSLFPSKFVTL